MPRIGIKFLVMPAFIKTNSSKNSNILSLIEDSKLENILLIAYTNELVIPISLI